MASLLQSWDGWDYYSDGTVIDNTSGSYYYQGEKVWSPAAPVVSGSWSDGWAGTLQGIANTAVNTWSAQTLMQQSADGRRYIEGQRIAALPQYGQQSSGGSLLLLAGTALLVWALAKN